MQVAEVIVCSLNGSLGPGLGRAAGDCCSSAADTYLTTTDRTGGGLPISSNGSPARYSHDDNLVDIPELFVKFGYHETQARKQRLIVIMKTAVEHAVWGSQDSVSPF